MKKNGGPKPAACCPRLVDRAQSPVFDFIQSV
jgi:hypothetical protein